MILKQYYLGCLAHASYLLADEETRVAVVVDPQRDVQQYVDDARQMDLQIRHVYLTHFHADFLAGHLELRDRVGAQIYLGARAKAEYAFVPMKDGDRLEFGKLCLETLETPGHTPESISVVVYDMAKDPEKPHAVLTGDTLFVGDVGRPDLRASLGWSAAELGNLLYHSLHQKLLTLPDETLVYPAHGAGTLCGKSLSSETVSSIGIQRRFNYALQPMTERQFLEVVLADQPDPPSYFTYDAILNSRERPTLEQTLAKVLKPLSLEEAVGLKNAGAQLLDARDPATFAAAYLKGSLNIGLGGKYASWAGTLLDREKPIVIIAEPGREEEAALRLGRIGFDHVAGYLNGGMKVMEKRQDLLETIERIDVFTLAEQLSSSQPPFVLDVRTQPEWQPKHIRGGVNIPLSRLLEQLDRVPRNQRVVVHCAGGYRSSIGASLLRLHGIPAVADLIGGIAAWEASNLPITSSS